MIKIRWILDIILSVRHEIRIIFEWLWKLIFSTSSKEMTVPRLIHTFKQCMKYELSRYPFLSNYRYLRKDEIYSCNPQHEEYVFLTWRLILKKQAMYISGSDDDFIPFSKISQRSLRTRIDSKTYNDKSFIINFTKFGRIQHFKAQLRETTEQQFFISKNHHRSLMNVIIPREHVELKHRQGGQINDVKIMNDPRWKVHAGCCLKNIRNWWSGVSFVRSALPRSMHERIMIPQEGNKSP